MTDAVQQPSGAVARPSGRTVLVAGSAGTVARAVAALPPGCTPLGWAAIETHPVTSPDADRAVADLVAGRYGWLALTSRAAWAALRERPDAATLRAALTADPPVARVAVVGAETAAAVRRDGLDPLVPDHAAGASGLVTVLTTRPDRAPVLFARGDLARPTLVDGLRAAGVAVHDVVVYRTTPTGAPDGVIAAWRSGQVDDLVVTSPSAVAAVLGTLGPPPRPPRVAALGPTTAAAATRRGFMVAVVGETDVVALVRSLD